MSRLIGEYIPDKISLKVIWPELFDVREGEEELMDFEDILDYLNILSRKKRLKTKDVERYVEEIRKTKLKEVI
jgi:hypothetical protein